MRMGKAPGLKLQAAIVQDNVPIEVAPGLFVGSIHAAFNVDALKAKKITHILNLAGAYATFPGDFAYLSVSIRDKDYANLLSCLPVATLFLQAGIDAGGVLVHWYVCPFVCLSVKALGAHGSNRSCRSACE